MARVADLGCIVCHNEGMGKSPASLHHIRTGYGISQRAPNDEVIPLCPLHHQHGGHGVAYHAGAKTWESHFGTELKLLEQVRGMLK